MAHTVIIVGGTSGLGLLTARRLAAAGTTVVATGRDLTRITARDRAAGIRPVSLRLDDLAEVRRFVADQDALGGPDPDALLLNAGTQQTSRRGWSADGLEETMAVNVVAPMALLDGLLPRLRPGARVVWTVSGTHDPAQVPFMPAALEDAPLDELVHPQQPFVRGDGMRWYATSKLCAVRLAGELAQRLRDRQVRVNAFDPGLMPGTGLARGYSPRMQRAWRALTPVVLLAPGARRPASSARTLADLAVDPRFTAMSGAHVAGQRPTGTSVASHDLARAAALYRDACDLVGAVNLPR